MCGIVGCAARETPAPDMLIEALKRLEYRGYDSAGIAVLEPGRIRTVREVGKIARLEQALTGQGLSGATGVGHTRWATHGRPSEANAHPHRDGDGRVVVVHNGIIENYLDLRRELQADGAEFSSETDSEVIAHLVARLEQGDLAAAVRAAVARLEGSFAIAVMHRDHPGVIIGARHDSPLVVGLGEDANYLASDVPALLPWTREVVYLDDGDFAIITSDGVTYTDPHGEELSRSAVTIDWSAEQAEKGGYPHFMAKEIHEQPTVVSDGLLGRLADDDATVALEDIGISDEELAGITRVVFTACGTSWHAAHVAKFWLEEFARLPVEVDYASEQIHRELVLDPQTLVIAISQSGETADTRAAVRRARYDFGAPTIGICNVAGSSLTRETRGTILTHAGPEIGVASTKAFMGQLVALLLFSLKLGQLRGHVNRERTRELLSALRRLPHDLERMLREADGLEPIAERYKDARDFLYLGRGVNYPIALEGALKLKEISYIHAEGYPAGEMKHGPIALIDEGLPILAVATHGRTYGTMAGNVEEARARGGHVIALVNPGDTRVGTAADFAIEVPAVPEPLSPMVNIVPLQILAYRIAVLRGTDVDQPRNLAKTVTVQ